MQIAIAGLGRMGSAIAARLIETGNNVSVWNRSAAKANAIPGAKVAGTPAELADQSDVILTILTDADAIAAVYEDSAGLLSGDVRGKLFIDTSTVQPDTEIALAHKVQAKGASFVECPVGGTTGPARQGKLIGLAGGAPQDFERARPVLEQLCRRVEHCGPVGAGAAMKLTINMPLMIYWQALGEALAISRHLKFDPARMMDLLADTSGGPNVLKVRGAALAKMLAGEPPGAATFDLASGIKDLHTMLAEGRAREVDLPLTERALATYEEAANKGWSDHDVSAQSVYWAGRKA